MPNPILEAALRYEQLGLSVIPMKQGEKAPALKAWKPYQESRAETKQIRTWFQADRKNVGIVLGEVSSGVVVRDFDEMPAYQLWASEHPDLAHRLPTAKTSRGRHVYARLDLEQFRTKFTSQVLMFDDGELRTAGLVVAPPSLHPSGVKYEWLIPMIQLPPLIDLADSGFTQCNREDRDDRDNRETQNTEIPKIQRTLATQVVFKPFELEDFPLDVQSQLKAAIHSTVPTAKRKRHELVFRFSRALKAIPAVKDQPGPLLRPILRKWWELSKHLSPTPWDDHLADFLEGWDKVRYPLGEEPMVLICERALKAEIPEIAYQFDQPATQLLVAICRELQRDAGAAPFFLSTRTAGKLLNVDHTTAHRYLTLLKNVSILELVEVGSQNPADRKATRFRYLAPL